MKFHSLIRTAPVMAVLGVVAAASLLSACGALYKSEPLPQPTRPQPVAVPAQQVPAPVAAVKAEPKAPTAGETALAEGVKAYQAGQYKKAEAQLKAALKAGLDAPAQLADAHKHLAFIYCTSKRNSLCAAAFKNAKAADPAFELTKAEAGHPMWAKTYRKALGLK